MTDKPLLTVCAWCGRVRDPLGEWCEHHRQEAPSPITTHGICPDCLEKATAGANLVSAAQ